MFVLFFVLATGLEVSGAPTLGTDSNLETDTKPLGDSNYSEAAFWNRTSSLVQAGGSEVCQRREDGVYPDTDSCYEYVRCQSGESELYRCSEGYLFDVTTLMCVPRVQATCLPSTSHVNSCLNQDDGLYPDYLIDCSRYYRCDQGKITHELTCGPDEAFSLDLQSCVPEQHVSCVRPHCSRTADGLFALPGTSCTGYYQCLTGVAALHLCKAGHMFHVEEKKCVRGGRCYNSICTGRVNGNYADTTQDCDRYFHCKGGRLVDVYNCPKGKKYNGRQCTAAELVTCDRPERTAAALYVPSEDRCRGRMDGPQVVPRTDCRSSFTCANGEMTSSVECAEGERFDGSQCVPKDFVKCHDLCSFKKDGYYSHELTECKEYYQCLGGDLSDWQTCPEGTLFDGQTCAPSASVTCLRPVSALDQCRGLSNGFHPDYWNNCRGYFYCSNKEKIFESICPNGTAWDGDQCSNASEFHCSSHTQSADCLDMQTGVYQDHSSGCHSYFYCRSGNRTLLSCPADKVYDGERCITTAEYTCPSSNTSECYNQTDGYRQDTESNCRSYFYCSQGHKITYVCPGKQMFNGVECVAEDKYECPFKTSDCDHKRNGYHADEKSGCRLYYYCFNGEKITSIPCNGRKIFDGKKCVLTSEPDAVCAKAVRNLCQHQQDGNHLVSKSNCRRYYTCKDQVFADENACPDGMAFNGTQCVTGHLCISSSSKQPNCNGVQPGFYQDISSNCKEYYFCISNKITKLNCPPNKIFNGEFCVSEDSYACPSI